jgi:septal ring factor EnvC (AmiA/AmiB activator)
MANGNLETRVSALEAQMQEIRDLLLQTAQEQRQTAANIARLEAVQEQTQQQVQATQQQLDNFIAASARVMAKISDDASRADAASTQNNEVLKRLANKADSIEGRLVELIEYVRRVN